MLTKAELDRAIHLHDQITPLMADEPLLVQRLALIKLSIDWLLRHDKRTRKEWFDSLKLGIEARMLGEVGNESGPVDSDAARRHDEGPPWAE